ncbi:hypothetical protein PDE_05274 [Penicillium oxalicum 114-2]|uniref:Zn(2)-C6 fungal-type domain-containing protein n=1 Tax=Penicillium oxalicum (strain 114-2 / CGMCC 5302) TaxID=933388 RepID=S8AVR9_PENO1|nr:hypothetical protein PDE_05274 [Penicillium oxalicum 114-2]
MDGDIDIFSDLINLDGIPSSYSTIPESILETELASQFDSVDEPPDTTTTNITRDSPTPKNEGTVTTSNVDEVPGSLESPPLNASVSGEDRSLAQQERKRRRRPSSPEPNYQQQVAKHNSKRKRTGQACDRCRCRRYKCDSRANGCLPCVTANVPCHVTDSVTGETFVRGAAGRMAAEIENLKAAVARLEQEKEQLQRILHCSPLQMRHAQVFGSPVAPSAVTLSMQSQVLAQKEQIDMLSREVERLRNANRTLQMRIEEQDQQMQFSNFTSMFQD